MFFDFDVGAFAIFNSEADKFVKLPPSDLDEIGLTSQANEAFVKIMLLPSWYYSSNNI